MRKLHPELDAYSFRFEQTLLDEVRDSYKRVLAEPLGRPRNQFLFEGGRSHRVRIGPAAAYYATSFESYPLLWVSNNNAETYAMFRRFFDALKIEDEIRELVDCHDCVVMYCGFLVIGDRAPETQWHNDFAPGAKAFTLITPLFDLDPGHGHLMYKVGEQSCRYEYTLGEAVFFGHKTAHTTEPYAPNGQKRVLLSMTFGTDKIEHWPQLRETLDSQAPYFVLPCGHVYGECKCLKSSVFERVGRWVTRSLLASTEIEL